MSVSCECCVLSGRGLCDRLITHSEGVLLGVVCLSVIAKPRKGTPWPQDGPMSHRNENKMSSYCKRENIILFFDYSTFFLI